jgi:hypothetical protein
MLPRRRTATQTLYLGEDGVFARSPHSQTAHRSDDLAAWCAAHEGADADLVVADALVHTLVPDARLPLADDEALRDYARGQFALYYGQPSRSWALATWQMRGHGVCALHGLALEAAVEIARAHGVRWRSVTPAWARALAAIARMVPDLGTRPREGVAWLERSHLTCITLVEGRLDAVHHRYLDTATVDCVHAAVHRFAEAAALDRPVALSGWGATSAAGDRLDANPRIAAVGRLDACSPPLAELAAPAAAGRRSWL